MYYPSGKPYKKQSKYKNKKIIYNGIKFDSKRECKRYKELLLLLKANEIKDLQLQKRFVLQDSFKFQGKTIRSITYIADFVYYDKKGNMIVEDTKGVKTEVYKIKKKMFQKKIRNRYYRNLKYSNGKQIIQ